MKKIKILILLAIFILIAVIITDYRIGRQAKNFVFDDILEIPHNRVGLVLGAGKLTKDGRLNLYYKYRIDAAVALYKAGKIDFVLVSGDNGRKSYDEPTDFKNDLIKRGVPEERIFLDYAGFRTLDSIVRAKVIFGLEKVTIISQKFHNERAIYIAKNNGIDAVAYNARTIKGNYGIKARLREYLARAKASLDITFNVEPKFLGKPILIE